MNFRPSQVLIVADVVARIPPFPIGSIWVKSRSMDYVMQGESGKLLKVSENSTFVERVDEALDNIGGSVFRPTVLKTALYLSDCQTHRLASRVSWPRV
jgi:hypothetical protein